MAKIENDKYYTSSELAEYVVNKTKEIIGEENITEYLEPSAGSGVFLDFLDKPYLAYDLYPEDDRIVKQDYLELDLEYKQGRCIIGNPPYGTRTKLYLQFFKKNINESEFISYILPISQLNNNYEMYEYDLIHSEDLGERLYSNVKVHCCLNIYKKPLNNIFKHRPNFKLKTIEIKEAMRNDTNPNGRSQIVRYKDFNYDIRICGFGASIGKQSECEGQYVKELCIKINNKTYKDEVMTLIRNAKWKEIYNMTKTPNLTHWQVYKYIKEQIPEIE